jgi:hypothetical protein
MFWQTVAKPYEPPRDERCEPVEGDEIDELVNWQLSDDAKRKPVWPFGAGAPE